MGLKCISRGLKGEGMNVRTVPLQEVAVLRGPIRVFWTPPGESAGIALSPPPKAILFRGPDEKDEDQQGMDRSHLVKGILSVCFQAD
jgi:hypothetical protein